MIDERLLPKLVDTVREEAIYMIDPRGRVLTWRGGTLIGFARQTRELGSCR